MDDLRKLSRRGVLGLVSQYSGRQRLASRAAPRAAATSLHVLVPEKLYA